MEKFPLFSFGKKEKEETEAKKQVLLALKALRDGKPTEKVVFNLQGLDREIADVVNEIVTKQQACAAEMKRVAAEANEGREARMKLEDLHGTWLDIMGGMEQILQSNTEQLRVFNVVTQAITKGDFSKKIVLDMKGDAQNLKNTINGLVDTLNCFSSGISEVLSSIGCEGRFGRTFEAPSGFIEGSWLDMVAQVNVMSTQMAQHFTDITATMNKKTDVLFTYNSSTLAELSKTVEHLIKDDDVPHYYSSLSQEVRTPLNGILGLCELLLDTNSLTSDQREMVVCMRQSANILVEICCDIISYERVKKNQIYSNEVSFSLRQTCERAMCEAKRYRTNVELNLDVDPQIPDTLIGHEALLEKFVLHITKFVVAINYNRDVLVTIKQLSLEVENIVLEINVNFPERSAEILQSLLSGSTDYGFDFPTVVRLVKLLKGTITAESIKPKETTLTITLSFKVDAQTTTIPAHLAQRELLVVCPHVVTQEVLARAIAWLGMKAVIAGSPDEALEILQRPEKSNYVAVLVDGDIEANEKVVEFVRELRNDPILLLVMADKELSRDLTRIAKPVGPNRLLDALTRAHGALRNYTSHGAAHGVAHGVLAQVNSSRILFAELNAVNQKVFARMLQRMGYNNVTMVETGAEALLELEKGNFDAIFLGNNQDMFETHQAIRLRQVPTSKSVPIIAVPSLAMTAEMRDKFAAAGLQYIPKPVNAQNLKSLLSNLLPFKEDQKGEKGVVERREGEGTKDEKTDEALGIEGGFVLVDNK